MRYRRRDLDAVVTTTAIARGAAPWNQAFWTRRRSTLICCPSCASPNGVSLSGRRGFASVSVPLSHFEQTAAGNGRRLHSYGGDDTRSLVIRRLPMSKADQFRQYAEEAMRWACQS